MRRHPRVALICALLLLALPPASHRAFAHPVARERVTQLDEVVAAHPTDAASFIERAEAHLRAGDLAEARQDLGRARSLDPHADGLEIVCGAVAMAAGDPVTAIGHLDLHLRHHPHDGNAALIRARAHAQLGQHALAVADFDSAIEWLRTPRPAHFMERLAEHQAIGEQATALAGLAEGRQRLGIVVALERAGLELELRNGDYEAALARLDAIRPAFGAGALWLEWRASVLRSAGREMEALATYSEALTTIEAMPEHRRTAPASRALESRLRHALNTKETTP